MLCGLLADRDIVGQLFGRPAQQVPFAISDAVGAWKKDPTAFSPRLLDRAPANEVITAGADLHALPIPQHALKDGGRYLDASLVVARNPLSGELNVSVHRLMVTGKDRLTFLIDPGRHLGDYVQIAEERGVPLEVSICNGTGLAAWFAAALPRLGDNKHHVAHHLIGRPLDMVRGQTVNVPAFASSQFVIEAEVLPGLREDEGPFGEVTGFYGGRDRRWVMQVKAITHRERPVLHTVLSGPEVWNTVGLTAEAAIYRALKARHPEVTAVFLPPGGCGFYQAVIQVDSPAPGASQEIIRDAFAAFRSLQRVVVVDSDVDISSIRSMSTGRSRRASIPIRDCSFYRARRAISSIPWSLSRRTARAVPSPRSAWTPPCPQATRCVSSGYVISRSICEITTSRNGTP